MVLEAAVKAGAPEGLFGWIDVPSLELTNTLMAEADIILAHWRPGMVKPLILPVLSIGRGRRQYACHYR